MSTCLFTSEDPADPCGAVAGVSPRAASLIRSHLQTRSDPACHHIQATSSAKDVRKFIRDYS